MTSFVEKRRRPRSNGQRLAFWTRRVLRIGMFCIVAGIFVSSAVTATHKAVVAPKAAATK